jgi:hypothetical protein
VNKTITKLTIGFQIALTFVATISIYIVFALLDSDFGINGIFGLIFFKPLIATIFSILTIFICSLVGLPIRLNIELNKWWQDNYYIAIIWAFCGLIFIILAWTPYFINTIGTYSIEGFYEGIKRIPNAALTISGWFLIAFSLLHFYPPRQLIEKIKAILEKVIKTSLVVLASLTVTSCNNSSRTIEKPTLLKANREAPIGWVYLTIYQDSTFEFKLTGIREVDDLYKGKVEIGKDSLFFAYSDSIPKAGKTAIYDGKVVVYIDGEYHEQLNISMTKLTK